MFTNRSVLLSSKTSVQRSYHRLINCENLSAANNSKSSYNNRQEGILKNSIPTNSVIRRTYFNYVNRPNNKSEANFVRGSHSNLCGQRNDILKMRNKVDLRSLSTATEPRVIATPRVCMHDVKTSIKVEGLPPNQPVTVRMALTEDRGKKFCSYAHFNSDKDGKVDLSTMPSLGGTYTGLVSSGLLMSLRAAPGEFKYARLVKEKIEEPLKINLSVHSEHETVEENSEAIAATNLKRYFVKPGTKVTIIDDKKVYGMLFIPPGPGPFPGVIDMYGGSGGLIVNKAALLSSHGIATLALPFFNYKDLPKTMKDLDFEYLEAATEYLMSLENVIPDRCGVLGLCQGGSLGLLMASLIDKVKAVVSVNGSAHLFYTTVTHSGKTIFQGFVPASGLDGFQLDEEGVLSASMNPEDGGSDSPHIVPVEKSSLDTKYYFSYGEGDTFKFYKAIKYLIQRLENVGNKNYVFETHKGAGHIIEAPNIPFSSRSYQPFWPSLDVEKDPTPKGVMMAWGGNVEDNNRMQDLYWPKAINFLKKTLRDESPWYQNRLEELQQTKTVKSKP